MNSPHELMLLIQALQGLQQTSQPAALATLTRTRGSTFRRPGTHMLVLADRQVVCELSGGCPQRDIVARALAVIERGEAALVHYNAESGLDVLMEMGCGGELEVLIEPLSAPHALAFADSLAAGMSARHSSWLATVFARDGQVVVPRRLVWSDGAIAYDGSDDAVLGPRLAELCARHREAGAETLRIDTDRGKADVLIERIEPPHALVVIGSSAAARALLPVASALGWQTTLVDHDPQRLQALDLPPALKTVCAGPDTLAAALPLDAHSSVVVMTHNLERDVAYLAALKQAPVAYVGALGSRERVGRMRAEPSLDRLHLHAPAGLDIGSETPEEIALAVAAEIMAVINHRSGGPLRDNEGAIH